MAVEWLRFETGEGSHLPLARAKGSLDIWIGIFVTLIAGLIRFHNLDGQSIWNDEMFTIEVARQSLTAIQPALVTHFHHPPLYFYLVHMIFSLMGESIWTLRFLSALCGTVTVAGVYYVATKRWSWKAGLFAGLLCCFSPFHLAYSQEGRPYAMAALLALTSCYYFLLLIEKQRRAVVTGYVVSTIALLYTHHWGIFLICAQVLAFLLASRSTVRRTDVWLSWLVIGGLYLPEIPALIHQSTGGGATTWWWAEPPGGGELVDLTGAFTGTFFKMASSVFELPLIFRIAGIACFALIFATYVYLRPDTRNNTLVQIPLFIFIGTLLIPFALSFYKPEIFLWYRYTVIIFPVACVITGTALAIIQHSRVAFWAITGLIMIGAYGTVLYFSWSKSNIREVAAYVGEITQGRRIILIRPSYVAPLLNYYYSGNATQLDEAYLDTDLGEIVDTARSFVYVSLDIPNNIREYMDDHFDKSAEKVFPGEAHMGIVVGTYNQRPEIEDSTEDEPDQQ